MTNSDFFQVRGRGGALFFSGNFLDTRGTSVIKFDNLYNWLYTLGMKNKNETKLIQRPFSIHPVKHVQILEHFISEGRATSQSDVVRQALVYYHDKIYPNYIFHLNPTAKKKLKVMEEEAAFESVPNEVFAVETLKGMVVKSQDGIEYVLLHQIANWILCIPLEGIKEWSHIHKADVDFHLDKIKETSLEEGIRSPVKSELLQKYNIVL